MGDLRKTTFYYEKCLIWGNREWGFANFQSKVQKGTPLRQIWSNKSFGVCASMGVLTLYGGEKSTEERP